MVGYVCLNSLVSVPSFPSFDALNTDVEERRLGRLEA